MRRGLSTSRCLHLSPRRGAELHGAGLCCRTGLWWQRPSSTTPRRSLTLVSRCEVLQLNGSCGVLYPGPGWGLRAGFSTQSERQSGSWSGGVFRFHVEIVGWDPGLCPSVYMSSMWAGLAHILWAAKISYLRPSRTKHQYFQAIQVVTIPTANKYYL